MHKKTTRTPKSVKPKLGKKTNSGWRWFTLKSQAKEIIPSSQHVQNLKNATLPLSSNFKEKPHHLAQIIKNSQITSPFPLLPQADVSSSFVTSRRMGPLLNLHLNTVSFTEEFSQPAKLRSIFILIYVTPTHTTHLTLQTYGTTMTFILMVHDKNMGWALVPTSWFSPEYK